MLGSQAWKPPGWGLVTRFLVPRWRVPSAPAAVFSFHFSLPPQFTSVFSSASNVALTLCPTAPRGPQTRVTAGQVPLIGSGPTCLSCSTHLGWVPSGGRRGRHGLSVGLAWGWRGAQTSEQQEKLWEAGPRKGAGRGAGLDRGGGAGPRGRGAGLSVAVRSPGASFCGVREDAHSGLTERFSYHRGRGASRDLVSPLTSQQGTRGSERASPVPGRRAKHWRARLPGWVPRGRPHCVLPAGNRCAQQPGPRGGTSLAT